MTWQLLREHAKNHKNKKKHECNQLKNDYERVQVQWSEKRKLAELLDLYKEHMGQEFQNKKKK